MTFYVFFFYVNNVDPDGMWPNGFHLDLHCLPNYLFVGNQNEKG